MSLRLPVDLAKWVDEQAEDLCNSRNGIVKLAITKLKAAQVAKATDEQPALKSA